ncbi:MAG: 3'(2'),5'-bisphosphate nucleotidase CysQ [Steroidobacteraceae bacterium]
MQELQALLPAVMQIADAAGDEIMRIYQAGFNVTLKHDRSPLTEADLAAQRLIAAGLNRLTPRWPMLGEESAPEIFAQRRDWDTLWLVDPLDGTREFVKRNGEFSVNIALVKDGEPVLGVVSAPARSVLYAAVRGGGAFRRNGRGDLEPIRVQPTAATPLRVLGSRSFGDAKLDRKLDELGPQTRISLGSALKFGALAEGSGDLYVRRGPTSEWDTAAGQAVVIEAGGTVVDLAGRPLRYNVREQLTNPSFIAYGDPTRDWVSLLAGL